MAGTEYNYQYRKIRASTSDARVDASLTKISGTPCLSPMEIDPRKGAVVYFSDSDGQTTHPELPKLPDGIKTAKEWVHALRKKAHLILPVTCYERQGNESEIKRYVVSKSKAKYENEKEKICGAWIPTKAFKASLLCSPGLSSPSSDEERLDSHIERVNQHLASYSEWVNGENYTLTGVLSKVGSKEETTVINNMFLGSGYGICSEIARSHITDILRQMDSSSRFDPLVDDLGDFDIEDPKVLIEEEPNADKYKDEDEDEEPTLTKPKLASYPPDDWDDVQRYHSISE